jgi:hypothetical protein
MHDSGQQPRYETRDVTGRTIVWSAIGIVALVLAGLASSWLVMKYFVTTQKLGPPASPFDQTRTIPPAPRLSVNPEIDLGKLRAEEKERLATYGWTDRNAGIVHVPIERAMKLSLERGFPVRSNTASENSPSAAPRTSSTAPKRQNP